LTDYKSREEASLLALTQKKEAEQQFELEIERLNQKISQLIDETDNLKAEVMKRDQNLQIADATIDFLNKDRDEWKLRAEKTSNFADTAEKQIAEYEHRVANDGKRIAKLEALIEDLRKTIGAVKSESNEFSFKVNILRSKCDEYEKKLAEEEQKFTEMEAKVVEQERKIAELEKENNENYQAVQSQVRRLTENVGSCKSQAFSEFSMDVDIPEVSSDYAQSAQTSPFVPVASSTGKNVETVKPQIAKPLEVQPIKPLSKAIIRPPNIVKPLQQITNQQDTGKKTNRKKTVSDVYDQPTSGEEILPAFSRYREQKKNSRKSLA